MSKEKTVNTLIREGLNKIKTHVDTYLKPCLDKINKENPNILPTKRISPLNLKI